MSLVICSNQIADGTADRQASSIYEPWAFRNQLTSTYKIPANAQVAVQSVKVNVDGRIVVSRQNNVFYQYFGKKLKLDGTAPQMSDTPYHPLRVMILKKEEIGTSVKEFSLNDYGNRVGARMSDSIYHPNLQDKTTVEPLRNASGLDFLGFKITCDQHVTASNVSASLTLAEDHYSDFDGDGNRNGSGQWTYITGTKVFKRNASLDKTEPASAIFPQNPLSLNNGSLTVNISGTNANANASGVSFVVGLSRYFINSNNAGFYEPSYYNSAYDADMDLGDSAYMDFGVGRNQFGELVCFQTSWDNTNGVTRRHEIEYWNNASTDFTGGGRYDMDGVNLTQVRYTAIAETLKVELYDFTIKGWKTVTEYTGSATAGNKKQQFQPIHQACWCLHPVLEIGSNGVNKECSLQLVDMLTPPIEEYDVKKKNRSGWWETLSILGTATRYCRNVESRAILDVNNTGALYQQTSAVNGSGRISGLNNVLILEQSEIYKPSFASNARQSLGFNGAVVDTPDDTNPTQFHSNFAPSLVSSQAMFVRLDSFNQRVVNALTGNKSQIVAHLPRFDSTQSTGRLWFSPNEMVFIDLDNPQEINVTDFNISFCYSNEQYAKILTGQSIVVLYFRKKPKELM